MPTPFDFLNAVAALEKEDGVIAFPTDTVYGLGCVPEKPNAVERIYQLKGRSEQKPLILMGKSGEALQPYVGTMTLAQAHAFQETLKRHWPGALTVIVPKSDKVPDAITRGFDTVGLRIPDCPVIWQLFDMLPGQVLATTSANLSGESETTLASDVFKAFSQKIDYLLMEDTVGTGQASTVIRVGEDGKLTVLRQGRIVID